MIRFSASLTWTACRTWTRPCSCLIRLCSSCGTIRCWRTPCCPSATARASSPKTSTTHRSLWREFRPSMETSTMWFSPPPVSECAEKMPKTLDVKVWVWFVSLHQGFPNGCSWYECYSKMNIWGCMIIAVCFISACAAS